MAVISRVGKEHPVSAIVNTMMKRTHRWIIDTLPSSDERAVALEKARQWLETVSAGGQENGATPDRVFLGEDGKWYFWTRGEFGTVRRLEGPFADRDGALRILDRHVRDSKLRQTGLHWPRAWSPMRLRRRPGAPESPH